MILARVKVGDFDRFWSVFTSKGAEQRRAFGSKGSRVFRVEDDGDELWVLFDWSKDGYQRFISDPKSKEIMASAGLQGQPEPVFVQPAGDAEA